MYEQMYEMLKNQVTTSIEFIGPEKAAEYLECNTQNARTPNSKTIDAYASDIENMNWEFTGETVSFRQNGTLHNGQHRLNAIIKAGISIPVLVVRGVPNETKIADWGKTRTISCWGKMSNLVVSTSMAGIAKAVIVGFNGECVPKGVQAQYIENNYDSLKKAEDISNSGSAHSIGRRVPMCLAIYVMKELDLVSETDLINFSRILNTGTVMTKEPKDPSAPLTLSRQILKNYEGNKVARVAQAEQFCITIQALLDYQNDKHRSIAYPVKNENIEYLNKLRIVKGFKKG